MKEGFFAIVNPAAGGGRCGKLAVPALERLRAAGIALELANTRRPGEAVQLAREAHAAGYGRFLAVGGDGTAYEIVNGLFPCRESDERPTLAFLPLGTGNSFLRDFPGRSPDHLAEVLLSGRHQACDVLRLTHSCGGLYFINLLTLGFAADVAATTNRRFKLLGEFGYILGVLSRLARLHRRAFPHRVDGGEFDRRRCLFLACSNSKFTGGKMMIAPNADSTDGLIELVRWGPIGRLGLLYNLPTLFDGTHIRHSLASRASALRIDFDLDGPVDVMIDGESLSLDCKTIEVLPGALDVLV